MLKVDNQKNDWTEVCIYQESNGDADCCPVKALGRRVIHLPQNGASATTYPSSYWEGPIQQDVRTEHISRIRKLAAAALPYPSTKGILVQCINMHSIHSGDTNALALAGYLVTQIKKMGRWYGATF